MVTVTVETESALPVVTVSVTVTILVVIASGRLTVIVKGSSYKVVVKVPTAWVNVVVVVTYETMYFPVPEVMTV